MGTRDKGDSLIRKSSIVDETPDAMMTPGGTPDPSTANTSTANDADMTSLQKQEEVKSNGSLNTNNTIFNMFFGKLN